MWRWRESNPRPRVTNQVFSGRSWLDVFSAPCTRANTLQTSPVSVHVPAKPRDDSQQVEPPDEARGRDGGAPGLTLRSLFRQRERSQCASSLALIGFQRHLRADLGSSARFSWDYRPKSKPITPY